LIASSFFNQQYIESKEAVEPVSTTTSDNTTSPQLAGKPQLFAIMTAKYSFNDDYSEGVHPSLLSALISTNATQQTAYGNDTHTQRAVSLIKTRLGLSPNDPTVGVWFVPSGTSANAISIGACLRPHESVIAASSGHIVVRETGAVEATGHKIINVPPENGKLTVGSIEKALEENWHFPHMAKPRLVYLSNATEIGTVYTRKELATIKRLCEARGLILFMDGARLGCAMASMVNDMTWRDVFELTDMFWIGGTKNGSLLGEAIVIKDPAISVDFGFHVKQHGCLLAKSWIMGAQFAKLFEPEEDLFLKLAGHANEMASRLARAVTDAGHHLVAATETNQVFAVLPLPLVEKLQQSFNFFVWERLKAQGDEEMVVIRLVTSWATEEAQVERFEKLLSEEPSV
jgi:threonine aldolase